MILCKDNRENFLTLNRNHHHCCSCSNHSHHEEYELNQFVIFDLNSKKCFLFSINDVSSNKSEVLIYHLEEFSKFFEENYAQLSLDTSIFLQENYNNDNQSTNLDLLANFCKENFSSTIKTNLIIEKKEGQQGEKKEKETNKSFYCLQKGCLIKFFSLQNKDYKKEKFITDYGKICYVVKNNTKFCIGYIKDISNFSISKELFVDFKEICLNNNT